MSLAPATVGWVLLGSSVGFALGAPAVPEAVGYFLLASGGSYVLAVIFGAAQMELDTQAWRRSGADESAFVLERSGHLVWTVTPLVGRDAGGLALRGRF